MNATPQALGQCCHGCRPARQTSGRPPTCRPRSNCRRTPGHSMQPSPQGFAVAWNGSAKGAGTISPYVGQSVEGMSWAANPGD